MSNSSLVTLPFDGTPDNPRPIYAEDRRSLYRDLWSDMVVERLTFVSLPGVNNFRITGGVLLADGAYARYNGHAIHIGPNPSAANVLVAVIGREDDHPENEQNIVFRLANRSAVNATHVNGNLVVATAAGRADGGWTLTGIEPSAIRIPDRTIAGSKLVNNAVANAQLADRAVAYRNIADRAISNRGLSDNAVNNRVIADNAVQGRNILDRQVSNAKLADNSVNFRTIAPNSVNNEILSGRVAPAHLPAISTATPPIRALNGWGARVVSWRRCFAMGQIAVELLPPANWAGLDGAVAPDVHVATVDDAAFIPSAAASMNSAQSLAMFEYTADGHIMFRQSGRSWMGGRVWRSARGVYMLRTPLG